MCILNSLILEVVSELFLERTSLRLSGVEFLNLWLSIS